MKIIKITIKIFISALTILACLILYLFILSPVTNNIILHRFSSQLIKYPLPEETHLIEKQSVCGKLNGNGNGMDYLECILIKSDLPIEQIKRYYSSVVFRTARNNSSSDSVKIIGIQAVNGERLESEYLEHQKKYF